MKTLTGCSKCYLSYSYRCVDKGGISSQEDPIPQALLFVLSFGKLRGVVDYREHNLIKKCNTSPIPKAIEMYDRSGGTSYFLTLDLNTGFHHI